jgi:hypothetical protein
MRSAPVSLASQPRAGAAAERAAKAGFRKEIASPWTRKVVGHVMEEA